LPVGFADPASQALAHLDDFGCPPVVRWPTLGFEASALDDGAQPLYIPVEIRACKMA
jgi:hypothetical protein